MRRWRIRRASIAVSIADVGLLRDDTTEGYDVIPNFFISATVPDDLGYDDDRLALHDGATEYRNAHFENRLFDRDTLILSHCDVNFLYVVKLYAQNDAGLKAGWRTAVRSEFRRHIRALLAKRFSFFALMPHDAVSDAAAAQFLRENFRATLGKVYAPYPKVDGKAVYSLALENPETLARDDALSDAGFAHRKARLVQENDAVTRLLREAFYVVSCALGEDPSAALRREAAARPVPGARTADVTDGVIVATGYAKGCIDAVRRSGWYPWSAASCRDPLAVQMFVFPHTNQADVFSVDRERGVLGPFSAEQVRAEFPAFKAIDLPTAAYYVWAIGCRQAAG